ncbi:MAG: 50S ribosomal protein L9 [Rickettsiaceae bacterium]
MHVLLTKPLKKLGQIGDVANVKSGFARNYLFPQGYAIRNTKNNREMMERNKADLEEKNAALLTQAKSVVTKIQNTKLTFIKQCARDGKLFGSVTTREIAAELSKNLQEQDVDYQIQYSNIELPNNIKNVGIFHVNVVLYYDISAQIIIIIGRSENELLDLSKSLDKSTSDDNQAEELTQSDKDIE